MTRHLLAAAALGAALSFVPADAHAQQSPAPALPRGFFLGANLVGASLTIEPPDEFDEAEGETNSGGGLGLQLGYAFRNNLALFVDATGTSMKPDGDDAERYTLGHFDVGARYHFASPTRSWAPFVEIAFGGRSASQEGSFEDENGEEVEGEIEFRGTSVGVGGGIQFFFNPRLAFNAGVRFNTGEFSEIEFSSGGDSITLDDFEFDATSTRLKLGLVWYPRAR